MSRAIAKAASYDDLEEGLLGKIIPDIFNPPKRGRAQRNLTAISYGISLVALNACAFAGGVDSMAAVTFLFGLGACEFLIGVRDAAIPRNRRIPGLAFRVAAGAVCGALFMGAGAWGWQHSPVSRERLSAAAHEILAKCPPHNAYGEIDFPHGRGAWEILEGHSGRLISVKGPVNPSYWTGRWNDTTLLMPFVCPAPNSPSGLRIAPPQRRLSQ